ncbi:hypothetical protein V9T40_012844 [Parthenolecanium corni]|uniref:Uncharacterized protein n=1 Tax=Parthenolecanium corni TaxID=536013 RepID=A0AAN9Y0Y7_9HEMI
MLEQVLKEMYIDPELLEALDEDDKETLLCLMKSEQIKRRAQQIQKWKEWDAEEALKIDTNKLPYRPQKKGGKSVKWLLDDSGEVVVDEIRTLYLDDLGENEELQMNDTRIPTSETDSKSEQIITNNEVKSIEAGELPETDKLHHKTADARLSNATNTLKNSDSTIPKNYSQTDISTEEVAAIDLKDVKNSTSTRLICSEQRSVLRELSSNEVRKVAKQVAEWEIRSGQNGSKPSSEVIRRAKPVVRIVRSNEPVDETDELRWRAQMRKANEVEARIRNITRLAREEHRRSLIENGNEPFAKLDISDKTSTSPTVKDSDVSKL